MKPIFITHAHLITPQAILQNHHLEIQNGIITAILKPEQLPSAPKDASLIDAQGAYVSAGFIDKHIHGFGGFGPELGTAEALLEMSEQLAQQGVCAFCPTLYCAQPETLLQIIQNTVHAFGKEKGARLVGYHLEGPFISPQKPGVMKPQDIIPVDLEILQRLYEAARGHIAAITVAPELPHIESILPFCQNHHILVQAGHTNATYEEFLQKAKGGITHLTHVFNAMSSFHHREPGVSGAFLLHQNISAEIIADGKHVHPDIIRFLRKVKAKDKLILVTDALRPTGQSEGPFIANGEEVIWEEGVWKRKTDKVWAGSGLTMLRAVQNLVSWGYPLPEAIACASTNPAQLLGLSQEGTLAVGMRANLILFDKDFHLIRTIYS